MSSSSLNRKRLLLIDQSLADFQGHHYEYAAAVADGARELGIPCTILASSQWPKDRRVGSSEAYPVFEAAWSEAPKKLPPALDDLRARAVRVLNDSPRLASAYRMLRRSYQTAFPAPAAAHGLGAFGRNLIEGIRAFAADGDTHLFVPTLSVEEFAECLDVLESLPARPVFHLLFRRDPDESAVARSSRGSMKEILGRVEASGLGRLLNFYTDTDELTGAYSRLSRIAFHTLPLPLDASRFAVQASRPGDGKLRLGYLGDARPEKGFHKLPRLVEALAGSALGSRLEFLIQANPVKGEDPAVARARERLRKFSSVRLLESALSPPEYLRLLGDVDVVLVPYQAAPYRFRSSGIVAEALAAGKPLVVPDGTWMSARAGNDCGTAFRSDRELFEKTLELCGSYDLYRKGCESRRDAWLRENSPRELVRRLRGLWA